jgi:cytochrome b6-f complex iron-sulfur subunit
MADDETQQEEPQPAADEAQQTTTPPAKADRPAAAEGKAVRKAETLPTARSGLAAAGGHGVVVVQPLETLPTLPALPGMPKVTRRGVLRFGFWAGLGGMLTGIVATILQSIYPKVPPVGFQGVVANVTDLVEGVPFHNLEAKVWLIKFNEEQARRENEALQAQGLAGEVQPGSILVMSHKCPHLGCTVPWKDTFSREDPRTGGRYPGWYVCPCHGSTYSAGGVRVFGPAPRSMDVVDFTIEDGQIRVDTSKTIKGKLDNPALAKPAG